MIDSPVCVQFTCSECKDKYIPNITGCPDERICYECKDKEDYD